MKKLLFIFAGLCILSCQRALNPLEMVSFLENPDHGASGSAPLSGLNLEASYQPAELLAYRQIQLLEDAPSDSVYGGLKQEYNSRMQFRVKLKAPETAAPSHIKDVFAGQPEYLSFGFGRDIRLIAGEDTLAPVMDIFEKSAGITNSLLWEVSFPLDLNTLDNNMNLHLMYQGSLSSGQPVIIPFTVKNLKSIPSLKL